MAPGADGLLAREPLGPWFEQELANLTTRVHSVPTCKATLRAGLLCSTLSFWLVMSRPLALGLGSGQALDLRIFLFLL